MDPVWLAAVPGMVGGAGVLAYGAAHLRFRIRHAPAQVHAVRTVDGHVLPLYRHLPPPDVATRGAVLCLHGLGANHLNFDFPGPADLAGYLARRGFDVFVAALRGDPDAVAPGSRADDWTFDDHVNQDLPAILAEVRGLAAVDRVHLLGHSMGGLLAYAYTAIHGEAAVESITALGSPVGFAEGPAVVGNRAVVEWLARHLARLPVRALARAWALLLGTPLLRAELERQCNPLNVDTPYARRALWHALANPGRRILLQFADWIDHDAFRSADRHVDYREAMSRLRVPLLVVAGAADRLARPENVMRAVAAARHADVLTVTLGRADGCQEDYGHLDMIFGRRVVEEVFPRLAGFLEGLPTGTAQANVKPPAQTWVQ
jgi:pimeloyl-ACP methyl ester carboxylesterase